ncbi:unnamed protein product [Prorocentrum cordatum]|uniref:Uncharacterized protein n=1 Tax=Prorocentrum cordatum TaxID=2364126 RepID=A0ABN9PAU8_9DINO|nr:unnamed protein product [Polarella glacialis]
MAPGASRSPRPCRGAEVPGDPGGAAAADAASAAGGGWSAVGWRSGGAWGDGAWGEGGDQWSDSGWQGGCGGAWGEGEDQWSSSSWQGGGGGQGEERPVPRRGTRRAGSRGTLTPTTSRCSRVARAGTGSALAAKTRQVHAGAAPRLQRRARRLAPHRPQAVGALPQQRPRGGAVCAGAARGARRLDR